MARSLRRLDLTGVVAALLCTPATSLPAFAGDNGDPTPPSQRKIFRDTDPHVPIPQHIQEKANQKDAQAQAQYRRFLAEHQIAGKGRIADTRELAPAAVDPGPGLPVSIIMGQTQQPQQTTYWCGPASVVQALALMGIYRQQSEAAFRLKTTTAGTAWSGVALDYYAPDVGRSYYPLADVMGSYMYLYARPGRYYPVTVPGMPSGVDVSNFRARVMSDTAAGYAVVGNVAEVDYAVGQAPRLPGHPSVVGPGGLQHIYTIHGYDTRDDTIFVTDPAANSVVSWGWQVPRYSRVNTGTLTVLNGDRGYVW